MELIERCLFFFQGLLALADDSVQVLKQALNEQPCSSINGTAVTMNDTAEILACIRKVTNVERCWNGIIRKSDSNSFPDVLQIYPELNLCPDESDYDNWNLNLIQLQVAIYRSYIF